MLCRASEIAAQSLVWSTRSACVSFLDWPRIPASCFRGGTVGRGFQSATKGDTEPSGEVRTKCLRVALVGVPNAGKSTLLNALVGRKVSAVSSKTNTTEAVKLSSFVEGPTQVVLYDTPGIVDLSRTRPAKQVTHVKSAWATASNSDLLLLVIDAYRQVTRSDPRIFDAVRTLQSNVEKYTTPGGNKPSLLVLNKTDRLQKTDEGRLAALSEALTDLHKFDSVFTISALRKTGLSSLRSYLLQIAPYGNWENVPGAKDSSEVADLAIQLVREQVFRRLRQELPYIVKQIPKSVIPLQDGSIRIEQELRVATQNLRSMLVGAKGAVIGEIGIKAREQLEKSLSQKVHLILNVKVSS